MLKRILVLVADTPSSRTARDYAFGLARMTQADVTGLAGIDAAHIRIAMPGGIGTSAYKAQLEEKLKEEAEKARSKVRKVFQRECEERGDSFSWVSFEGDPDEMVRLAVETRDLVVSGCDTTFGGTVRAPVEQLLDTFLPNSPRPTIICPDKLPASDQILVAYDGSAAAMRAVQMFSLLGVGHGGRICVTSIDESQEIAARRTAAAAEYLRSHGHEVTEHPIASAEGATVTLRKEATDRRIRTLVMGAYGHTGLREIIFGSTTQGLLHDPPCALFLYH